MGRHRGGGEDWAYPQRALSCDLHLLREEFKKENRKELVLKVKVRAFSGGL